MAFGISIVHSSSPRVSPRYHGSRQLVWFEIVCGHAIRPTNPESPHSTTPTVSRTISVESIPRQTETAVHTLGRSVLAIAATGVYSDGPREVLGIDVFTGECEAAWLDFLRSLVDRGFSGVGVIISDGQTGLDAAIRTTCEEATRLRCQTHFMTVLFPKVPKSAQPFVATLVCVPLPLHRSSSSEGPHYPNLST